MIKNSFFRTKYQLLTFLSFIQLNKVSLYVDPVWNQLSSVSRRLVGDISSLRRLLHLLIEGDAVNFLTNMEGLRQAALASLGVTQKSEINSKRAASRGCPSWFLMDQADRLLASARSRVYADYSKSMFLHFFKLL